MSTASPSATATRTSPTPHDPADVRLPPVGRPLPGHGDPHRRPRDAAAAADRARSARSSIRGHLTPGYYKDPERNAAAFDARGVLPARAISAFVDDDGRLRFRGRIKEMVKTGGINVAPLEVEEVLLGHPAASSRRTSSGCPDPRQRGDPGRGRRAEGRPRRRARRRCGPSASTRWPRSRCRSTSGSWRATSCPSRRPARSRSSACRKCSRPLRSRHDD